MTQTVKVAVLGAERSPDPPKETVATFVVQSLADAQPITVNRTVRMAVRPGRAE